MTRPPLETLRKYRADYSPDTDFSAFGRLLQSIWREKKLLPLADGKLGNFLPNEFAKETRANYLTDNIKTLVQYEVLKARNDGKLISEPRIWNNLLSSQPLCFNLFGEFHFDLKLASKYFHKLFPDRVKEVTSVQFEYSPGRGNENFTGDHSAFDVFVEYKNLTDKLGFIGIEVKYAESLKDDKEKTRHTFSKRGKRYLEIANESKLFPELSLEKLKEVPLQQIWRDHLLALSLVQSKTMNYEEGFFVYLFPSKNDQCQIAVDTYIEHLATVDESKNIFYPRHLDLFIKTLRQMNSADWTLELQERYLGEQLTY